MDEKESFPEKPKEGVLEESGDSSETDKRKDQEPASDSTTEELSGVKNSDKIDIQNSQSKPVSNVVESKSGNDNIDNHVDHISGEDHSNVKECDKQSNMDAESHGENQDKGKLI